MKATVNALLGAALLAAPAFSHTAIKPPSPDKALTPNSSNAPPGCKLLLSDKGWPADSVWKKEFPGVFKKLKGTEAPDFMVQATSVEVVQKAVNFAREHNIRLSVITTGHDFHGRETARSGLRLDMAALQEPTVFSNEWKCGDTLKPTTKSGRVVEEVQQCRVEKPQKRSLSGSIAPRNYEYEFFEKRDGVTCEQHRKLRKRHGPEEEMPGMEMSMTAPAPAPAPAAPAAPATEPAHGGMAGMAGMGHGDMPAAPATEPAHGGMEGMEGMSMGGSSVPTYNIIKNEGKPAYARISASMYNEKFYEEADKSGFMTAGAQHGGVSVLGGWAQAGGHNPFVNRIGMQVDNIVELEVVTADGKFQKVSECNNPELFWALRGGGGSTFGVVTGGTVKVHPTFPVVVSRFFVNSTSPGMMDAHAHFLQQGATLRDKYGLQGYFYMYEGGFQSVLHMPADKATLANAKAVTEPLMAKMEELANAKHIEPQYYEHKTYKAWYNAEMGDEDMEDNGKKFLSWYDGSDGSVPDSASAMMNPMVMIPWAIKYPAGPQNVNKRSIGAAAAETTVMRSNAMARTYLDSRLLSDKHVNSVSLQELSKAVNATFPRVPGNHVRGFLYGGGEQAKPAKDAMGLLPAWRDMTYHFIINAVPGNIRHDYNIGPLAKLFPDAKAYVNEAAPGEPDWKNVFWGEHYEKLETIKKKVDPNTVFWCSPCVGADLMTYDDERLCKNPDYPAKGPAPQTYPNKDSKTGIASLPGTKGIPNPLMPIIKAYMANGTLPDKMPKSNYFKIAMGEGGSAGGKFKDMDPYNPGQKLKEEDTEVHAPEATGAKPSGAPGAAGAADSGATTNPKPGNVPAPDSPAVPAASPASAPLAAPLEPPAAAVTANPANPAPATASPTPAAKKGKGSYGGKSSSKGKGYPKMGGFMGMSGFGKKGGKSGTKFSSYFAHNNLVDEAEFEGLDAAEAEGEIVTVV